MDTTREFSQLEGLMKEQSEVLQMITQGRALHEILSRLTDWVEQRSGDGALASILCAGEDEKHLFHCAGNSLAKDYIAAIDGLEIGPEVGSCGTAAYTKKMVVVSDIAQNPLWRNYKHVALEHQLRACWSTPLIDSEGRLKGTFAVYYREPKEPTEEDLHLIKLVAHTALIAIEHQRWEDERRQSAERERLAMEGIRQSEQRFQNLVREATIGIIVLRGEDMVVDVVNETYGKLISKKPEELLQKMLFSVIPESEKTFRPIIEGVRTSGQPLYLYHQPYQVSPDGKEIKGYLNLIYQPYREFDGSITGVIVLCQDVTEVVLARQKLEQSEASFRDLVMQAPVAIAVLAGKELIAETVNDDFLQLIGKSREGIVDRPLYEVIPEISNKVTEAQQEIHAASTSIVLNELPFVLEEYGSQKQRYLNGILKPIIEQDRSISRHIVIAHDVTEQVAARRKIEESEQHIRAIIESAPFPIGMYVGRDMRIQFANQSIIDVWGKGSDVIGKRYAEVLPELANQQVYEQLDSVFTTGVPFHAKNQQIDLVVDGKLQPYYFNYSFTPLYNADGSIYGVMNTAAEVTELVVAYKKLEESEQQARLAIEASEQGTFLINIKTDEIVASRRMEEIFDVHPNADRMEFVTAFHPDDLIVRKEAYERAYRTSILDYEGRLMKKDGRIVWIRVKGKVYFDSENRPERLVGVIQDITEQKKFAEALSEQVAQRTEELATANRQLVAINDELQQFAYITSHDLQEPLRKIRIFSSMLSQHLSDQSEATEFVGKITASAERMSGLISSLLEYSRLTNTKTGFELVDLNLLVEKIMSDYEIAIQQNKAVIKVDPLPMIESVPLQMNQLFYNLIGNALKFAKKGVQPLIEIKATTLSKEGKKQFTGLNAGKEYVAITIKDNGIGFDQSFANRIFTVFERLPDAEKVSGYGIGLALCKKVVQNHHGLIIAAGRPNQGAEFTAVLPLRQ